MRAAESRRESSPDIVLLARLHAALDSVVETEELISEIKSSSALPSASVTRVGELVGEARELLRMLLARQR